MIDCYKVAHHVTNFPSFLCNRIPFECKINARQMAWASVYFLCMSIFVLDVVWKAMKVTFGKWWCLMCHIGIKIGNKADAFQLICSISFFVNVLQVWWCLQACLICLVIQVTRFANKLILHLPSFFKRSRLLRYKLSHGLAMHVVWVWLIIYVLE